MTGTSSIISLITQSGGIGLAIVILLVIMSVFLWAVILLKALEKGKDAKSMRSWFSHFKNKSDLESIQKLIKTQPVGSFSRIAQAALQEISHLSAPATFDSYAPRNELIQEALQRAIDKEKHHKEKLLAYCALSSNISPFLGLFGTVWGIMHSFLDIGQMGSANITVVAPGIAEALVTTIFGLVVAIPASAAYNYFVSANRSWEAMAYDFSSEILGTFKRSELQILEATGVKGEK